MSAPAPGKTAMAWAQHLAAPPVAAPTLSPQEARRVQHYQERLYAALQGFSGRDFRYPIVGVAADPL